MFRRISCLICICLISGCSSVVEPIKIPNLRPDSRLQEKFTIDVMPLTFSAVEELNLQSFRRLLSLPGDKFSADLISDEEIKRNNFPEEEGPFAYRLGVGDEITFVQTVDTPAQTINAPQMLNSTSEQQPIEILTPSPATSVITTTGRIGNDGSLLLIGVGRIDAKGRHISDLRDEVRTMLIRKGKTPDFQLEIEGFNSQKAYLTTDSTTNPQIGFVLPITDQNIPLRQIIASAGIAFNETVFTIVKIQRDGKTYSFSLSDLFAENAPKVFLKDQDHVFIQNLEYVKGKVFLVGGIQPRVLEIQPELRQTLAEILFAPNGPLEQPSAQRSAVYILRGRSPIKAYHLDAQNPARILVADALEMRPNDIVYVSEQPINTFNRVLETILPLRLFSRDTRDGNIP